MADPQKPAPPPPPPPLLVPEQRWRFAPYLADVPPGGRHGHLSLDEVREIIPYGWGQSPRIRFRAAGIAHTTRHLHLRPDSAIWVRRAEPEEVALGELVRAVIAEVAWARPRGLGVCVTGKDLSWHLPHEYTGSGILRLWRLAREGDALEVQRMIRGQPHAPGEELVLRVGTSPAKVAELVRAWVKGWAP
ncbi:hypothetical protein L6R46_27205 [Myxococcota bacterium]|nr:hypothetical protein [Myxococcota bacterium]